MKIWECEQRSEDWHNLRRGKITGSTLKDIIIKRGTTRKIGSYQLVAENLGISDDGFSSDRERGIALEPEAREKFCEKTGKTVIEAGFCTHDKFPEIGWSPDGLIKDKNGEFTEAIEIKCLSAANHIKAIIENEIPSEYNEQIYQAFTVNEKLETLHFILYDPRITVTPLKIFEVKRSDVQEQVEAHLEYQLKELEWVREMVEQLSF